MSERPLGPTNQRPLVRLLLAGVICTAAGGCSRIENYGLRTPASTQAEGILALYGIFFWVAAGIALLVYGLIAWSVVRYRRRSDVLPSQRQYQVPLEIAYTVIPLLLVGGLFVSTFNTQRMVSAISESPDLRVDVTAFQWDWRFDYGDQNITISGSPGQTAVLVLPVDSTINLTVTSEDVVHSFWVPDLLFKRDMFPGSSSSFDIDTTTEGTFPGRCAEFCGLRHAQMDFQVQVVSVDAFDRWVASQQEANS